MHIIEKITFVFIFIFVIIGAALSHWAPDYFKYTYVVEDGLIQWLQVAALVITFCVCLGRVIVLRRNKPPLFLVMTLLLAFLFLFAVGEEISWGQRLFNIQSPGWFQSHNAQEEINLHNLVVMGIKLNRLIFSVGLGMVMVVYVALITPLYRLKRRFSRVLDALAVPIPKLHHIVAYGVVLLLVQGLVTTSKRGEIREFGMLFLFFLNVTFPYNKEIFSPEKTPVPSADGRSNGAERGQG